MPRKPILKSGTLLLFLLWTPVIFAQTLHFNLRPSRVSTRDLLGLGDPASRIRSGYRAAQQPDTLRILAIRVDFQEDNNPLTTGNGKFILTPSDSVVLDPPPHDATYFEHQLLALANYYKTVSNGKLMLLADVYPKEPERTYTVSNEMSYYNPLQPEELVDQRLAELFQEGFQLADAADPIDFSQYDNFILFHAGVGADFALDFDPTPQDIPSVFLDFETLRRILGNDDPTYEGIPVQDGRFFIKDGIILPETQSQEGFEVGLLGTAAIMFGNQLGLPILFNPDNGRSGIGIFGLMDQGSGNFFGLLPAEPCAWSKLFLGWETAVEVSNGVDLPIAAPRAVTRSRIYKIPISEREYFLLENRHRDLNNDGVAIGHDANGTRVEFRWDEQGQRILAEGPIGVITRVNEYDFGLPGSGILIWHIDENVILANLEENRVNANPERRGVDLEEADGAQDIGQVYGFLDPGAGAENGVIEDMFWASNEINMLVNSSEVVAFTPETVPNSWSNEGANSHISITDFSEPDTLMTFSVRSGLAMPGFPQYLSGAGLVRSSPLIADLDGASPAEIVALAYEDDVARIYVWRADGSRFIENSDVMQRRTSTGLITVPLAVFAELPGNTTYAPAVAEWQGKKVVVAATNARLGVYLPEDADQNGRADSLFVFDRSFFIRTNPMILSEGAEGLRILVGVNDGRILVFDERGIPTEIRSADGQVVTGLASWRSDRVAYTTFTGEVGLLAADGTLFWATQTRAEISRAPVVGDLDGDGAQTVLALADDGRLFAFTETGEPADGFPSETGVRPAAHLSLGEIDGDGFLELAFVGEGQLYSYNHLGVLETNFPIRLDPVFASSTPILLDLAGDPSAEIAVGAPNGRMEAFGADGRRVSGFPLPTGLMGSSAGAGDLDGDGDLELAVQAGDGVLYVWDLAARASTEAMPWASYAADRRRSNANTQRLEPTAPEGTLMPANLVYNYPNPTEGNETTIRYRLNFPAKVRIRIFDLAGELVDELTGPGFARGDNEVRWQLEDVQSGVYLARVEAVGDNRRDVVVVKIAVVK